MKDKANPEMRSEDIAISVRNLSKNYRMFNHPGDRIKQFLSLGLKQYHRDFAALNDVSFDIRRGEAIGIIGRNGSGKSTLLQVVCGISKPTAGTVFIKGRVSALLELGAGFSPEFTGRENIYTNAVILGLNKEEIDARFEDIVAFADIGDFLDQPVRSYSSGMYVRLAFAVVAHVDAEVLIVDEALSVGDMYFQAKCMAHMNKLIKSGVTVLFVSHDISSVKALCDRAVFLDHGKVVDFGPTDGVVEAYYSAGIKSAQSIQPLPEATPSKSPSGFSETELADQKDFETRAAFHRTRNGMAEFLDVQLLDITGHRVKAVDFGQEVVLRMIFKANVDLLCIGLAYHIRNRNGVDVIYSDTGIERCHVSNLRIGEIVTMDWHFVTHLQQGDYSVAAMLSIPQNLSIGQVAVCDFAPLAVNFQVAVGKSLPIYAAAYWTNSVSQKRRMASGISEE